MSEQGWIFVAGIVVAAVSYLSKNFLFDQILEYKRVKGRIGNRLRYYENVITNAGIDEDILQEMWSELRQLSCDLEESYSAIPNLVMPVRFILGVPSQEAVGAACSNLIFLSNGAGRRHEHIDQNYLSLDRVRRALGIKI